MALAPKTAQFHDLDGVFVSPEELHRIFKEDQGDLDIELELSPDDEKEEKLLADGPDVHAEIELTLDNEKPIKKEFDFSMPKVPGGEDQSDIEVEDSEDVQVEDDPWKWGLDGFLPWLENKIKSVPRHTGKDTAGIERAISYLDACDKEVSKANRMDINNVLDAGAVEKARDEILNGIERLEERLSKIKSTKYPAKNRKKKASDSSNEMVKEGSDWFNQSINVPLFISYVARVCVNSMVSAGHDIEDVFKQMIKKYALSEREQVEVLCVLNDWGAIAVYRDRGFTPDEDIDINSPDNFDWAAGWLS